MQDHLMNLSSVNSSVNNNSNSNSSVNNNTHILFNCFRNYIYRHIKII